MNVHADMLNLIRSRVPGYALPRPFYTDEEVFRLDMESIWYRDWLFAIPACEIPQTGNFVTMQVGEYAIVIVRGADGRIRAFHNACRHRGSRVCTARMGSAATLVCPVASGPMTSTVATFSAVTQAMARAGSITIIESHTVAAGGHAEARH